jgi:hypothetical protein
VSADPVRAIADAVLYEGYLLWPYRRSALKNQQRFTFGGVYPAAFAARSGDRSVVRMECLLEAPAAARTEVTLRCLHLVERQPMLLVAGEWCPVDELSSGAERWVAWQEATEREFSVELAIEELRDAFRVPVTVAAGEEAQYLDRGSVLMRSWEALDGVLELAATEIVPGVQRLAVTFANSARSAGAERDAALRHSFLSAHLVARCQGGAFVSCTDPPVHLHEEVAACRNEGVWPVLVGDESCRTTVLGSPIILSDHPRVAPESPGDTFDGGEIDALLIYSIRGLADAEREEMRATDPRTRAILERSLALAPEQIERLHGAVRELRRVER